MAEERNWKLGIMHAGITASAWGLLPIALKSMLEYMDPYTITWYRFLAAASLTAAYLARTGGLPSLRRLDARGRIILAIATAGLVGNYVLYLLGLSYISPGSAQVLIQLAPMFLLLGGLLVFRESFSPVQWLGLITLVSGLALFFHDRLDAIAAFDDDLTTGVGLIIIAALVWAAYALAQKMLIGRLTAQGVLVVIYVTASIALLPSATPGSLLSLGAWPLALLTFCSLNTIVAYGSFAEALRHWEASRISAILALTPILTLIFATLLERLPTGYVSLETVDTIALVGVVFVVVGSSACALGSRRLPAGEAA